MTNTIEVIAISSREQWLSLRKQDITASVAGALLGVHEYTTPYALWASKTGHIEEEVDETPAMRRGRRLEPIALEELSDLRPTWAVKASRFYYRDPAARLGATPGAFASCPERGLGIVHVKTVERMIFRKKWRDAETGEIELPLWIAVQAIVEAHLTGAKWACVVATIVGHGIDLEIIEVPIHAGVIERVRTAVRDFWEMVARGETPAPDYGRDGAIIERLFRTDDGGTLDLTTDNALPALLAERERLSDEKSAAERRLKEIKAEILAKIGSATFAEVAGGRLITAKTVHRKGYVVNASSYRDVRIKTINQKEAA